MKKLLVFGLALVAAVLLSVSVFAAEKVIYENDFSDASTLSDFTQYQHEWVIENGVLHATSTLLDDSVSGNYSHLLYNTTETLTDYTVEVDYLNVQATGGLVVRADASLASHKKNGFCGYITFSASTGDKGAFGYATKEGEWGSNIKVGSVAFAKGDDLHVKTVVKGNDIYTEITMLDTGDVVFSYDYTIGANETHTVWDEGTVGIRINGTKAYFDNLKITVETEDPPEIPEEPETPEVPEDSENEIVIYENDFSDASTLSDFTEYRHEWEIRDGALYNTSTVIDGESSIYGHIIYNGVKDLTDYIVEVDYLNVQAAGGIIFNADGESVDHQKNGIYGYVASVGSNGNKGYLGYGKDDGTWGDYINTGAVAFEKGANIHIKVIVKGTYVNVEMTNIDTGEIVYSYIYTIGSDVEHVVWNGGSVGLRLAGYVACMDNFKITTAKYVKVPGEAVIYENDFSDASTISDFTQYRHAWEIKDGALYATSTILDDSVSGAMSHILYNATETLTDYIVEVDYLNPATTGGLVFRADESLASHANNGFYGYVAFVASDANKGAFGYANAEGAWGGNVNVGSVAFEKGDDIHIKATVKGNYVKVEMTKIETGELVYTYTYSIGANAAHTAWNSGTVGLRLNGTSGCFDNFRICSAADVVVPSDTPAEEFGEGITFGTQSGKYIFDSPLPSMPLTFEATMYFPYNVASEYTHIILANFNRSVAEAGGGFLFEITKGGQPSILFYDKDDNRTRYTFSNVSVYNGKKTNIAITVDVPNSKISCYVDGTLEQTLNLTIDPTGFGTDFLALGTDNREVNLNLFRGALINLACYSDVRTAEEIVADMTAQGTDDLILHFDLSDKKYGEDAIDLSGSNCNAIYEQYFLDEYEGITDYAYSIAVVGDPQHNVQYQPETFAKLYDWLYANAADKKMAFMLGLGDITNDDTDEQWAYSLENIAKLDGVIPYALTRGNHDGSADSYSARFDNTLYAAAIGDNYYLNRANSYQKFKAGDINYLVITLNYNPSDAELAWAKGIADANPYHRVIVITHSNLSQRASLSTHGENVWNKFVKLCPNVEMVLSGHVINDKVLHVESKGDAGNVVNQFMVNGQCVDCTLVYADKEAAGLVAMFYFDESGKNLKVEYYSTTYGKYFMECNQFETTIGNIAGDTNYDGEVSFGDAMSILKAVVNESVCYNGDANGDAKLGLADVLRTLKQIVK